MYLSQVNKSQSLQQIMPNSQKTSTENRDIYMSPALPQITVSAQQGKNQINEKPEQQKPNGVSNPPIEKALITNSFADDRVFSSTFNYNQNNCLVQEDKHQDFNQLFFQLQRIERESEMNVQFGLENVRDFFENSKQFQILDSQLDPKLIGSTGDQNATFKQKDDTINGNFQNGQQANYYSPRKSIIHSQQSNPATGSSNNELLSEQYANQSQILCNSDFSFHQKQNNQSEQQNRLISHKTENNNKLYESATIKQKNIGQNSTNGNQNNIFVNNSNNYSNQRENPQSDLIISSQNGKVKQVKTHMTNSIKSEKFNTNASETVKDQYNGRDSIGDSQRSSYKTQTDPPPNPFTGEKKIGHSLNINQNNDKSLMGRLINLVQLDQIKKLKQQLEDAIFIDKEIQQSIFTNMETEHPFMVIQSHQKPQQKSDHKEQINSLYYKDIKQNRRNKFDDNFNFIQGASSNSPQLLMKDKNELRPNIDLNAYQNYKQGMKYYNQTQYNQFKSNSSADRNCNGVFDVERQIIQNLRKDQDKKFDNDTIPLSKLINEMPHTSYSNVKSKNNQFLQQKSNQVKVFMVEPSSIKNPPNNSQQTEKSENLEQIVEKKSISIIEGELQNPNNAYIQIKNEDQQIIESPPIVQQSSTTIEKDENSDEKDQKIVFVPVNQSEISNFDNIINNMSVYQPSQEINDNIGKLDASDEIQMQNTSTINIKVDPPEMKEKADKKSKSECDLTQIKESDKNQELEYINNDDQYPATNINNKLKENEEFESSNEVIQSQSNDNDTISSSKDLELFVRKDSKVIYEVIINPQEEEQQIVSPIQIVNLDNKTLKGPNPSTSNNTFNTPNNKITNNELNSKRNTLTTPNNKINNNQINNNKLNSTNNGFNNNTANNFQTSTNNNNNNINSNTNGSQNNALNSNETNGNNNSNNLTNSGNNSNGFQNTNFGNQKRNMISSMRGTNISSANSAAEKQTITSPLQKPIVRERSPTNKSKTQNLSKTYYQTPTSGREESYSISRNNGNNNSSNNNNNSNNNANFNTNNNNSGNNNHKIRNNNQAQTVKKDSSKYNQPISQEYFPDLTNQKQEYNQSKTIHSQDEDETKDSQTNSKSLVFSSPAKSEVMKNSQLQDSSNPKSNRSILLSHMKSSTDGPEIESQIPLSSIQKTETSTKYEQIILEDPKQEVYQNITAQFWCVFDSQSCSVLYGKRANRQVEMASLTQIMTCLTVIKFLTKYELDSKNLTIKVSKNASTTIGTSANLKAGEILTVEDLLHGLMLPSGNDAAITLAEGIGVLLNMEELEDKERLQNTKQIFRSTVPKSMSNPGGEPIKLFLKEMNQVASELGMIRSFYASVHGMANKNNLSTPRDIALLSSKALRNQHFKLIVGCQQYSCTVTKDNGEQRVATWKNTNKLLGTGFCGIKTGFTDTAGPCLSSSYNVLYKQNNPQSEITNENDSFIVVVLLNCQTLEKRWEESFNLTKWAIDCWYPDNAFQGEYNVPPPQTAAQTEDQKSLAQLLENEGGTWESQEEYDFLSCLKDQEFEQMEQ